MSSNIDSAGTSGSARGSLLKAGVIGWPVDHSLSPVLHSHWLATYGIDGRYDRIAVAPENLQEFLRTMKKNQIRGVNVTIPHKEAAYRLMDSTSEPADRIQAVNTIIVRDDGSLHGDNSDGFGFIESLRSASPDFQFPARPALVLGAGGASRAILAALQDAGVPNIRLANRTRSRAEAVSGEISVPTTIIEWPVDRNDLADVGLVVNTTSLGLGGSSASALVELAEMIPPAALVMDIVYTPLETGFLKAALARGCRTVDGLGMLMHQARPGFEAWFSARPVVTPELKAVLITAMER